MYDGRLDSWTECCKLHFACGTFVPNFAQTVVALCSVCRWQERDGTWVSISSRSLGPQQQEPDDAIPSTSQPQQGNNVCTIGPASHVGSRPLEHSRPLVSFVDVTCCKLHEEGYPCFKLILHAFVILMPGCAFCLCTGGYGADVP